MQESITGGLAPLKLDLVGQRTLTLTPGPKFAQKRTCGLQVEGGGQPPYVESDWSPEKPAAKRTLTNAALLHEAEIAQFFNAYIPWRDFTLSEIAAREEAARENALKPVSLARPYEVRQRLIAQTDAQANVFPVTTSTDLLAILRSTGVAPDTILTWALSDLDQLACLDVDFHRGLVPLPSEMDRLARNLQPAPSIWWRTQGGGLHCLYVALDPFTGEELAVGAAAQASVDPVVVRCKGTVEVIPRSRHPGAIQKGKNCGPVHSEIPSQDFQCLARFSHAEATEAEIEETAEELSLTIGERLDHSQCPIDPWHKSNAPNPVVVGPTGIYCFSCQGRTGDGFRSWGSLRRVHGMSVSGERTYQPVMDAVKGFAHFRHGSYLLSSFADEIPSQLHRTLWRALLKRQHGADPRLDMAFDSFGFVRGASGWLHADTLAPAKPLGVFDVQGLPHCNTVKVNEDGEQELVLIKPLVTMATNSGTLPGYPPLLGNSFLPIFYHHNPCSVTPEGLLMVTPVAKPKRARVRYIEPRERIAKAEAEKRVLDYFPGLNLTYVKALIIAMGCAESGRGEVPRLWATGESGSAKTTTIKVVNEMYGEEYCPLVELQEDRRGQAFGAASRKSRLVLFDDAFKREDEYEALQAFFLHINRSGFSYHEMFVGPTTEPVRSAVIITDWNLPAYFTQDIQFSRRFHLIRLKGSVPNWLSMGHVVEGWWTSTPELRAAAESLHSYTVDEFFPAGDAEDFSVKMAKLGVRLVKDEEGQDLAEEKGNRSHFVRSLILAIGNAQDMTPEKERHAFVGAREVKWGGDTDIGKNCTALVESLGAVEPSAAQLMRVLQDHSKDIGKMFRLAPGVEEVKFMAKAVGRGRTYVRIEEVAKFRSPHRRVNKDVFSCWPPEAITANGVTEHTEWVKGQSEAPTAVPVTLTMEEMMAGLQATMSNINKAIQ